MPIKGAQILKKTGEFFRQLFGKSGTMKNILRNADMIQYYKRFGNPLLLHGKEWLSKEGAQQIATAFLEGNWHKNRFQKFLQYYKRSYNGFFGFPVGKGLGKRRLSPEQFFVDVDESIERIRKFMDSLKESSAFNNAEIGRAHV